MTEAKISSQLDYKIKPYTYPTYGYQKILPNSGTQNVAISATAGDLEVQMDIPADKAINLSESILSWQLDVSGVAGAYNWVKADTVGELRVAELLTQEGNALARINDLNLYMQVVRPRDTSAKDMQTFDAQDCLYPCNSTGATNYFDASGALAALSDRSYLERKYNAISSAVASLDTFYRRIKLGYIVNSLFAVNKDILFPKVVRLRLVFNGARVGWTSTSATDPTAGNTALTFGVLAAAGGTQAPGITNLCLYLATETNLQIVDELRKKVNSGMSLVIPYVWSSKVPLTGSAQNVTLRIGSSYGKTLSRVIHTVTSQTESGSYLMYDHNNYDSNAANKNIGAKVTQYYLLVDGVKTTQFDLRCGPIYSEDYMVHRNRLKGSCIESKMHYMLNWFHEEDFANTGSPEQDNKHDDNAVTGLDLSIEKKIDFFGVTMSGAASPSYNHYDFIIVQRALTITPDMISIQ